jgi:hypothetical protein
MFPHFLAMNWGYAAAYNMANIFAGYQRFITKSCIPSNIDPATSWKAAFILEGGGLGGFHVYSLNFALCK